MNRNYPTVASRAGHCCEYCRAPEAIFNLPFEVEHIVPSSRQGSDDDSNLRFRDDILVCSNQNQLPASQCRSCTDNLDNLDNLD